MINSDEALVAFYIFDKGYVETPLDISDLHWF